MKALIIAIALFFTISGCSDKAKERAKKNLPPAFTNNQEEPSQKEPPNLSGAPSQNASTATPTGTAPATATAASIPHCPANYAWVPGNPTPRLGGIANEEGVAPFCIAKFEMKHPTDVSGVDRERRDNTAVPVSQPQNQPWSRITRDEARAACERVNISGFTFSLISNGEWQTVARNIENTSANWSGGKVGEGAIPRGHSDASPTEPLPVWTEDNPYSGTGNDADIGWEQKRTHRLSTGHVLWDLAGNVWEYVYEDKESLGLGYLYYNNMDLEILGPRNRNRFGPLGRFGKDQNMGYFTSWYDDPVVLRGGGLGSKEKAGVFSADVARPLDDSYEGGGFRCVAHPSIPPPTPTPIPTPVPTPSPAPSCPPNYVGVPGDSTPGLGNVENKDGIASFCVAKFEMKHPAQVAGSTGNIDNAAAPVSQAQERPWTSITRDGARAACGRVHIPGYTVSLISNGEWQAVARNIENTAANWKGGKVGEGVLVRGHSDSRPDNSLPTAAETDPYDGTGNNLEKGWDQKRTQMLSTGEAVWDFAGNVSEWVFEDKDTIGLDYEFFDSQNVTLLFRRNRRLFGPLGDFGMEQNLGHLDTHDGSTILRGNHWANGNWHPEDGVFSAFAGTEPDYDWTHIGFRCVARPAAP